MPKQQGNQAARLWLTAKLETIEFRKMADGRSVFGILSDGGRWAGCRGLSAPATDPAHPDPHAAGRFWGAKTHKFSSSVATSAQ
jgi:hypothetical protein